MGSIEHEALDAYSHTVTSVAEQLTPRVAGLRFRGGAGGRRGDSAGSAVVLTNEGHLLTNAHVVGEAQAGEAALCDGTRARIEVVGRDTLSDLAVVRAGRSRHAGPYPHRHPDHRGRHPD